jgi:energy-coupling factor transporter ATP-binding protein EcfA2
MLNPFATRYTRPGQLAPLDEQGRAFDPAAALAALEAAGGCGAFIGPHGSGKSTRLHACAAAAAARGERVCRLRLRRRVDTVYAAWRISTCSPSGLVCVDSLEQAGRGGLAVLRRLARVRGVRLLGTCHRSMGLPVIAVCSTSLPLLERLVEQLAGHESGVTAADVAEAFRASNGNLREALFLLYDRVEAAQQRQRS